MKRFLQDLSDHMPTFVLAVMLGSGFFFSPNDLSERTFCIFKRSFLIDCPGCGLTHAFLAIARGDFREAMTYNLAAIPLYLFFFGTFVRQLGLSTSGIFSRIFTRRFVTAYSSSVILLILGQWIFRTAGYFSTHPFPEYLATLKAQPLQNILWIEALWRLI